MCFKMVSRLVLVLTAILLHFACHLEATYRCEDCRRLVEDFHRGVDDTKNGGFSGGDVFWEEENLKSYANSELRFVEILENVCVTKEFNCFLILEQFEDYLEAWWQSGREVDLFEWFCVGKVSICCQEGQYGTECLPCPEHEGRVCSGRGKCVGSGTRDGDGTCHCDTGYGHNNCNECTNGFYRTTQEDNFICVACDTKCDGCDGPGDSACVACKSGFIIGEGGCKDLDECGTESICGDNEVCSNSDGSYLCDCMPGYRRDAEECIEDVTKEEL